MIFKIYKYQDRIPVLGKKMFENNNKNSEVVINKIEYEINSYIKYDEYDIN